MYWLKLSKPTWPGLDTHCATTFRSNHSNLATSAATENSSLEEQLPGKVDSAGGLPLLTADVAHAWSGGTAEMTPT